MWSHLFAAYEIPESQMKMTAEELLDLSRAQMMLRGLFYGNPTAAFSNLTLETFYQSWVMFSCSSVSLFYYVCNSPYYRVISLVSKWDCSTFNPIPIFHLCCREGPSWQHTNTSFHTRISWDSLLPCELLSATSPSPPYGSLHHFCCPSSGPLSLFTVLCRKWGLKICAVLQPYPDCIMLHPSLPFCLMADLSSYPLGWWLLSSQWELFSLPTITPRYFPIIMFPKYLCWLLLFLSRCSTVTFISIK